MTTVNDASEFVSRYASLPEAERQLVRQHCTLGEMEADAMDARIIGHAISHMLESAEGPEPWQCDVMRILAARLIEAGERMEKNVATVIDRARG